MKTDFPTELELPDDVCRRLLPNDGLEPPDQMSERNPVDLFETVLEERHQGGRDGQVRQGDTLPDEVDPIFEVVVENLQHLQHGRLRTGAAFCFRQKSEERKEVAEDGRDEFVVREEHPLKDPGLVDVLTAAPQGFVGDVERDGVALGQTLTFVNKHLRPNLHENRKDKDWNVKDYKKGKKEKRIGTDK